MSFFTKNIVIRRVVLIFWVSLLLSTILYNFIRNSTAKTDENQFIDPVSRFYITREIPVYSSATNIEFATDTIKPGYMLTGINNVTIKDTNDLKNALNNLQKSKYADLKVITKIIELGNYTQNTYKVKIEDIKRNFVRYLHSATYVIQVMPGGASDKAGLKEGDYIIKLNDKEFKNALEADSQMRNYNSDKPASYQILRNNRVTVVELNLVKYGIPFLMLIQMITSLIFLSIGSFIAISKPRIKAALLIGLGLIFFSVNISNIIISVADTPILVNYRNILFLCSTYFGTALLIHSTYTFPVEIPQLLKKRWVYLTPYIYAFLIVSLMILNNLILRDKTLRYYTEFADWGLYLYVFVIRIIFNKYYTSEYKKINRLIGISYIFALFVVITISYTLLISKHDLPAYLMYLNLFTVLMVALSYMYVIARYKLLDLKIKIRRNIQYFLVSSAWKTFALAVLIFLLFTVSNFKIKFPNLHLEGTTIEVIRVPLDEERQELYQNLFMIGISIFFSVVCWKLKNQVQNLLDKKFHRASFDYRRAATEFAEILVKNLSIDDLTVNIITELAELALLKKVGIIVFRNDKITEQEYFGLKNNELKVLLTSSEKSFIQSVGEFREEFRVDYLPEPHKFFIREYGFNYIVPVYSKMRLLGALFIGEKKSEVSLSSGDFEFLLTIAGQVAVALENSFLYEDLAKQERIKHELEIARSIQLASLPDSIPNINGLDISGISIPALEVGGDFYDFLDGEPKELMLVIGDVSGKGTSAALYMSKIQGIMRTLHEFRLSPRKLLIQTNQLIYKYLEKSYFITATAVNFNTEKELVQFSRAGHLPIYYYNHNLKKLDRIVSKGMVLGLSKDTLFERNLDEIEMPYNSGDAFIFVTDGITESRNSFRQEFSEDRLLNLIEENYHKSAEEIRNKIIDEVNDYTKGVEQFDDMTVVVVKAIDNNGW